MGTMFGPRLIEDMYCISKPMSKPMSKPVAKLKSKYGLFLYFILTIAVFTMLLTAPRVNAEDAVLDMPELESLLALSAPDAQERLISRLESQDARTLATLMILLHRKSEHVSLLAERNKMLQDKERLEYEKAVQEKETQISQLNAKHAEALLKKEEAIEKLRQRIEQLLVNRGAN